MFGEATRNRTGRIRRLDDMAWPSSDCVVRPLGREDAAALAALESRCAGAARWGEAGYQCIGMNGVGGWAAVCGDAVLGFILVRSVADEMEILNLAVDPDARRQRIGARLAAQEIEEARRFNVKRVYLEVRESNSGARAFYSSAGFIEQGRRKNYYSQAGEDALVLVFHLD
jgi:ribosomal-protein-alanine N-acetyltransferase